MGRHANIMWPAEAFTHPTLISNGWRNFCRVISKAGPLVKIDY